MLAPSFIALFLAGAACAAPAPARRQAAGYLNPLLGGGSLLDAATTDSPPLGEPLNVIISSASSPAVLTDNGFLNYVRSLGLSNECLEQHEGAPQTANLGDGMGAQPQLVEYRQDYGVAPFGLGTCLESLIGGNHLRAWRQAGTGALFLAVSHEQNLQQSHTISPDGYDKGRDTLAASAMVGSSYGGTKYATSVASVTGLLQPGSAGVNHGIAIDGVVKVFTVTIQ